MTTCPKCEVCNGASHHWIEHLSRNPSAPSYACKHCDALGEECETCGGCERPDGFTCPDCDGEGVVEKRVPTITFRLVGFNPRRFDRGVEAARVEVLEDGCKVGPLLWMSERDLKANIAEFGDSEDLEQALAEYAKHRRSKR